MRFENPWWLPAGFLACVLLVWMWRRYDARQHAALARFVSAHLRVQLTQSISVARRRTQRGLFLAALALLFVALAGPLVGYRWEQISRRGNEIVFAIDTSRSMTTPDIKPNRLGRAKLAIDDFANRLDGDAVGIVAFAGSAFLVCPITLDYGAFHESLGAIDTNTIPHGGTNIASAIREATTALRRRPGSDKILILVTDGEDLEGSALVAAQTAKQQDDLKIFTVGVGTAGGDLIPVPPDQGGGFVKDENGAFVKSRLDEAALKAIAAATGGFYVPLGAQGEGLDTIFNTVLGPLAKHELASRQQKIYTQRYQWPLAASLGLLLTSLLIGTRRRRAARKPVPPDVTPNVAAASSLLLLLLLPMHPARAAAPSNTTSSTAAPNNTTPNNTTPNNTTPNNAAPSNTTPSNAAPSNAAAQRDPKSPAQEYNLGTAAYRARQFPQAAQAFQQSISHAPSSDPKRLADQEDAYYNLGNTLYRTGQNTEQSAPPETLKKWTEAVKAYETALQLRPDDADSKYNRDFVKRKIDALQQKQNQQNQGQNQQQNNGGGQPPPSQPQGQPPQGQPPNPQQNGKSNDQKPDDQKQGQQPPPPQSAGQPPTPPPNGDPQHGDPQRKDQPHGNPDNPADDAARAADNQHPPGEMSREEARELLDSVKGDERRPPATPLARSDADEPPEKPIKNW
ncbi:MAG: Ca-activated chloride channel [Gammaproteobacteria bacterium]|nr:Ca-activated chloride channel [Gammaproteobacteria bacterium]